MRIENQDSEWVKKLGELEGPAEPVNEWWQKLQPRLSTKKYKKVPVWMWLAAACVIFIIGLLIKQNTSTGKLNTAIKTIKENPYQKQKNPESSNQVIANVPLGKKDDQNKSKAHYHSIETNKKSIEKSKTSIEINKTSIYGKEIHRSSIETIKNQTEISSGKPITSPDTSINFLPHSDPAIENVAESTPKKKLRVVHINDLNNESVIPMLTLEKDRNAKDYARIKEPDILIKIKLSPSN